MPAAPRTAATIVNTSITAPGRLPMTRPAQAPHPAPPRASPPSAAAVPMTAAAGLPAPSHFPPPAAPLFCPAPLPLPASFLTFELLDLHAGRLGQGLGVPLRVLCVALRALLSRRSTGPPTGRRRVDRPGGVWEATAPHEPRSSKAALIWVGAENGVNPSAVLENRLKAAEHRAAPPRGGVRAGAVRRVGARLVTRECF